MDRPAPGPPSHREMVFCHLCQNEFYRDENGLQCPRCQSDVVEIIEAQNDPRTQSIPQPSEWADDPDEDDIDNLRWQEHEADQIPQDRFRMRYERDRDNAQPQQGGWGGLLGNVLRLASDYIQPPNRDTQQRPEVEQQPDVFQRQVSPDGSTVTRHMHGNGYSFTIQTSSRSGGLQPRDPDNPQPFQRQPQDINDMMQQIFSNIGVFPPGMQAGFPRHPDFIMNPEMGHAASPFPALFQLLGLPAVHGDAVYSQEGMDRIISQLMEQHQTGNAPGPAEATAIESLPQREITEKDLGESGSAECSICMESVALGDKVTVLPCEHWFHFECIKAWLSEHDTCPHCRKGIMPSDQGDGTARQSGQTPRNDIHSMPGGFPGTRPGQSNGLFDRMRDTFGSGSGQ